MIELVKRIKQKGHWRVEIRPTRYHKERIKDLAAIKDTLERNAVNLSGRTYPHDDRGVMNNGSTWVECRLDYAEYLEFWRFYQSGQFIQFMPLDEDYRPGIAERAQASILLAKAESIKPKRFLSVLRALYTITEILEFSGRLAQDGILDPEVYISIKLVGADERMLFFSHLARRLHRRYICSVEPARLTDIKMPSAEFIARRHKLALDKTIELFELFNWDNPSQSVLAEDQRKFLEGIF